MNILSDQIINAIRHVCPGTNLPCALHEPSFSGNEWSYVKDCLDTGWVSSAGKYVDHFEEELAAFTGAGQAVAVVNGTAALQVCLQLAGVQRNDEVLVPSLTFVATANAVTYCGAVPHFVDSEEHTLGIDPAKLAEYIDNITESRAGGCYNLLSGRRIKALVPMHTFGHPVDLDPLVELCVRNRIELVEDAAESIGSYYKGRHTGTFGICSALSFNGNKTITTGGGGAILTNDKHLGRLAKHLTTTAKLQHRWEFNHDMIGFNYRMPNINAALGCAQLEQLPEIIEQKRRLAQRYREAFAGVDGVRFHGEPDFARSNYWLNVIVLENSYAGERDAILAATNDAGVMTRPAWTPMHRLPMFAGCPSMELTVADNLVKRLINIPSSSLLGV